MERELSVYVQESVEALGLDILPSHREDGSNAHAQTCDPVSGMTVILTVSLSRRTQAIFSRELRAPINLLKVRMFFSSALNLMMGRNLGDGVTQQRCPVAWS